MTNSNPTVTQLAEILGVDPEQLLSQLKDAGLVISKLTDTVSDSAKKKLLNELRATHEVEQKPVESELMEVTDLGQDPDFDSSTKNSDTTGGQQGQYCRLHLGQGGEGKMNIHIEHDFNRMDGIELVKKEKEE